MIILISKPIHRLNQLPKEFLTEELSIEEPLRLTPNNLGIDLLKMINPCASENMADWQEGVRQRTYARRIPALRKKLKKFLIDSKSFMYPHGVEPIFNKPQEHYRVNSGKIKLFHCKELLNFV